MRARRNQGRPHEGDGVVGGRREEGGFVFGIRVVRGRDRRGWKRIRRGPRGERRGGIRRGGGEEEDLGCRVKYNGG